MRLSFSIAEKSSVVQLEGEETITLDVGPFINMCGKHKNSIIKNKKGESITFLFKKYTTI